MGDYNAAYTILNNLSIQNLLIVLDEIESKSKYLDLLLEHATDSRLILVLHVVRFHIDEKRVTEKNKEQARLLLPTLSSDEKVAIVNYIGEATPRLFGRETEIERLANLQFSFLEEKRKKKEEEEHKAQIEAEKKVGGKKPTTEPKVDISTVVENEVKKGAGDVTKGGFAKNPVTDWTKVPQAEKDDWKKRAADAWNKLVNSVKGTELEKVAQGKSIKFDQETALKHDWYAWQEGTILNVGKLWVKSVEADPRNEWDVLAHEMGGHFEYGTSYLQEIMNKVIEMLPQAVRDKLRNDEEFRVQFYATYQYADTEIYGALRQLRYRYPPSEAMPTAAGSLDPYKNIQIRLNQLKDNFPPEVAKAVLKELKRRIDLNSEILSRDKEYFKAEVIKMFGNIF